MQIHPVLLSLGRMTSNMVYTIIGIEIRQSMSFDEMQYTFGAGVKG